jgi:hypothetical protein
MGILEILGRRRAGVLSIASKHGARNVRVFGSVAQGSARKGSDVDFLVDMAEGRTLLDLVGLCQELESLLKRKVDVVTSRGLSPHLRGRILSQAVPL